MVENYLMHYGVKGMKWGIRNYQNADGTLTEAGKKRYAITHPLKMNSSNRAQMKGAARRYKDTEKWAKKQNKLNVKTYKGKQTKEEKEDSIDALIAAKYKTDAGKTHMGPMDMVRDIAAAQYYRAKGSQIVKNVLGISAFAGIGIGGVQWTNRKAAYYKDMYKQATDKVISDYKQMAVKDILNTKTADKITDITLNGASRNEIEKRIK